MSLPFVQQYQWQDKTTGAHWELFISSTSQIGDVAGHRLLVLLDGNLSVVPAALMQHTRMDRGVGNMPACTVVGVGYPGTRLYDIDRRAHDYLPPPPPGLHAAAWQGGNADTFADVLDASLIPWLEAQQGTTFSEIGLFGHSYGGLFALYKLLNQPGRFSAFFCISPSLWWANGWLLDQVPGTAARCANRVLYLGIGSDERAMPGDDAQRVTLHHERDLQGRFSRLKTELKTEGIAFTAETFAGEDHGSMVYPGIGRALKWLTLEGCPP